MRKRALRILICAFLVGILLPALDGQGISSPLPGSVLAGINVTFTWPAFATAYQLDLGTLGVGSSNLYDSGHVNNTSLSVTGLPTVGQQIYARLWSLSKQWTFQDFLYTAAGAPVLSVISAPAPGGVVPGTNVTFVWTAGAGVRAYQLDLGTLGVGSFNLYDSGHVTSLSTTVGLPMSGKLIYARIYSLVGSTWKYVDCTYSLATSYSVDLSWDAPVDSPDPVAGYNVFRAPSGSSTYKLLNPMPLTATAYVDSTVQNGSTYEYTVESVDKSNVASAPSSPISVSIP